MHILQMVRKERKHCMSQSGKENHGDMMHVIVIFFQRPENYRRSNQQWVSQLGRNVVGEDRTYSTLSPDVAVYLIKEILPTAEFN